MLQLPAVRPRLGKLQATPQLKNAVFWDVAPCRSCEINRRLGGTYHLHFQGRKISTWMLQLPVGWEGRKLTPPITGAAGTLRRRCSEGSPREHPRLQREGCSLPNSPLQVCPSRRRSEARQRNSGSIQHVRCQSQLLSQWNRGPLRPYSSKINSQQVSQFGLQR
jgi:hypothetical protein